MGIRTALEAEGLSAQKKFGQHFLTDPRVVARIADAAELTLSDTVLEIGPGLGHLTRALAERARSVIAIELDRGLARKLQEEFAGNDRVKIAQGDFLERAPAEWIQAAGEDPGSFKVVANVPYYITSAILRHLLEADRKPETIVLTVQKQVAQRLIAQPPRMNLLAVSAQFFSQPRIVRTIAAGAFYPRPQVDSAVVRLDVYRSLPWAEMPTEIFFRVVRAGFGERRKQLRNALTHNLKLSPEVVTAALSRAHIAPTRRAETLRVDEWLALIQGLTLRPSVV